MYEKMPLRQIKVRRSQHFRQFPALNFSDNYEKHPDLPPLSINASTLRRPERGSLTGVLPQLISCACNLTMSTQRYSINRPVSSLSQLKTVLLKLQKPFISHLTQFVRHCTSVDRQVVRKLLPVKWDLDVRTVLFFRLFGEIREQFFSRCAP